MYRTSLIAITSLFLSVALVAEEPTVDLEEIAVNVMTTAFQVADYDTVEVLFGKLSTENKKKFLLEAVGMTMMMSDMSETSMPRIFMDTAFFSLMMNEPAKQHETIERWAAQKSKQTQLFGRLTLLLFEESAKEKHHAAVYQPLPSTNNSYHPVTEKTYPYPPRVGLNVSPAYVPAVGPGHDDGYLDLGPYGRVYVKGLSADERREAIKFHLSKQIESSPQVGDRFERLYFVEDLVEYLESHSPFKTIDVLMILVAPKSGTMDILADAQCVIIRQTEEMHVELENTLNQMRQFIKTAYDSERR